MADFMNNFDKHFYFRQAFVKVEKEARSSIAYATNDGWGIGSFISKAETQEEFERECQEFLKIKNI